MRAREFHERHGMLAEVPAWTGQRQRGTSGGGGSPEALAMQAAEMRARFGPAEPVRALFTDTPFTTAAAGTSKMFLQARDSRRYLLLQNNAGATLTIGFGKNATAASFAVPAGAIEEWNFVVPTNSIYIWCSIAGAPFVLIEG